MTGFGKTSETLLVVAAGVAVLAGLVGAFIGLSASGFWYDELWTAWTVGPGDGSAAVLGRAVTDVHPPLYYLLAAAWGDVVGRSEAGLRSFSALAAVAAILVFGLGTRAVYSLPARLVAMVLAVSSTFWFDQSQFARSYALDMLVSATLLVLGLRLCRLEQARQPAQGTFAALVLVAAIGAWLHFYLVLLAVAVCLALVPFCRRWRWPLLVAAAAIVAMAFAYIRLVMTPNAAVNLGKSWISGTPRWYQLQLVSVVGTSASGWMGRAIAAALAGGVVAAAFAGGWRRDLAAAVRRADRRLFPVLVPLLVVAGGISSSILLSPNFTARNVLISAPFVWASAALFYDAGVARLGRLRPLLNLLLAVAALGTIGRLAERQEVRTTPFRESAAWIAAQPGCEGVPIMVFVGTNNGFKPGEAQRHARADYGHYLKNRPLLPVIIGEPLPLAATAPAACPVVGWGAHWLVSNAEVEKLRSSIEQQLGQPVAVKAFERTRGGKVWQTAYVFIATPQTRP